MKVEKNLSGWFHTIIATDRNKVVSVTNRDFNDKLAGFFHNLIDAPLSTQKNRIVTYTTIITAEKLFEVLQIFDDYQQYKEIEFLRACINYLRTEETVDSLTLTFHNN